MALVQWCCGVSYFLLELTILGHTVTALVRNPDAIQPKDGLTIFKGTPLNKAVIDSVFQEPPTGVITTLGHNRSGSGPHYMTDVHTTILAAMRAHGIRKLVVLQALGVGESKPNLFFAMRWMIKYSSMAGHFADHDMVDEMVRKEVKVNVVRARPTRLEGGEKKPVVFFGNDGKGIGGFAAISIKSVAGFMVDAAEKRDWDGSSPVIAN
ncbi:MAG: hypothetical protein Q9161_000552 [Pseudevernia consocians]